MTRKRAVKIIRACGGGRESIRVFDDIKKDYKFTNKESLAIHLCNRFAQAKVFRDYRNGGVIQWHLQQIIGQSMKKNRDIPYCEYRKAILIADELATKGKIRDGKS